MASNPPYLSSIFSTSAPPEHPQSFQQSQQQPQHPVISQQQQLQQHQQQHQHQQVAPPQQNQPKQKPPRKPRQPRKQAQQQQQQHQQVQQQQAAPQQQQQQQLVGIDAQRFAQLQAEVGQLHQLVQGIIHRLDAYGVPSLPGGHHAPLLLPQQHAIPVSAAGTSTLGGAATANSAAAAAAAAANSNTINFNALLQASTSHDVGGGGGGGGGENSAATGVGGVSGLVNGDHGHHHDDGSGGGGGNVVTHHQDDGGMGGDNNVDDDDDEESRQLQLLSANLVGDQSLGGPSVSWGDAGGGSSGSGAGPVGPGPAGFDMAYPPQGHIFHIQLSTSAGGKNYVGGGPNGASVVVNNWTRQHGYRVITRRSKIKNDRYHLTMSCALSGNKYRPVPGPTQEQIEEARRNGQRKPYQRRIGTDKCNCPFRFVLRETAKHSSTFEVRWTMVGPDQQPAMHNHGPDPKALAGDE